MKFLLIILVLCISARLKAQEDTFPVQGEFYRLDNADSLNTYSRDSIRGELQYIEIYDSLIYRLVIPIVIYKSYNNEMADHSFSFDYGEDYEFDYKESLGYLEINNGKFYAKPDFFKRDKNNFERKIFADSSVVITIELKNNNMYIDGKLFKRDDKGIIFQRFTGY